MNGWVFNVLVSLIQKKIISCLHNQAVLISPMQDDFDYRTQLEMALNFCLDCVKLCYFPIIFLDKN